MYTMGSNAHGKLGINEEDLKTSNVPCLVENLEMIEEIACGTHHTLALGENQMAYAWGQSKFGATGILDSKHSNLLVPHHIECLENVISISGGEKHSLFL